MAITYKIFSISDYFGNKICEKKVDTSSANKPLKKKRMGVFFVVFATT